MKDLKIPDYCKARDFFEEYRLKTDKPDGIVLLEGIVGAL